MQHLGLKRLKYLKVVMVSRGVQCLRKTKMVHARRVDKYAVGLWFQSHIQTSKP